MKSLLALIVLAGTMVPTVGSANLCDKIRDQKTTKETVDEVAFYKNELFPDARYHGSEAWNRIILECNRKRDTKGNEVTRALTGSGNTNNKNQLKRLALPAKVIRGHYNFFGNIAAQLKYRYILSKENGVWTMIIPYNALINDLVKDRIDFYMGYRFLSKPTIANNADPDSGELYAAWTMFEKDQVDMATLTLKSGAKPIAETLCTNATFFPGSTSSYNGKSNANSGKRDKENRHISKGKIQYRYDVSVFQQESYWDEGCRVEKDEELYWQEAPTNPTVVKIAPHKWILDNFVAVGEKYWSSPGNFDLKILLKGYNESQFDKATLSLLSDNDYLTVRFATKFLPYKKNQMYKSNIIQFNNFSTMTTNGTYFHEIGHAFGLDDEYGNDATRKSCNHSYYKDYGVDSYQMCTVGTLDTRTIYHFVAVSRYGTEQDQCQTDNDCKDGQWCDAGVDFKKNQCRSLLADGASCPSIGGGHACRSEHCKFAQCYTPGSVSIGGQCFVNDQCAEGKCNNLVDGTVGTCVCDQDGQCGTGKYCDVGLDFKQNACRSLKSDDETCALVDGARTCKSGHCRGGRCYTPDSLSIGDACGEGKCNNAVDGTKGTCVCNADNDCKSGYWCDKGLDLNKNSCKKKFAKGEICGKVGELGVGHRCLSGNCKAAGLINLKCK